MDQLSGVDASLVHMEGPKTPWQIGTLLFYDVSTAKNSFVRFKDILATFEDRVCKDSTLRKRLQMVPFSMDHPYWVDDADFDIEYHVRHLALPKPGDWRQLCIMVSRLHTRRMDMSRPLWEAYIIEGLDNVEGIPKGGFAMYIKLHHALIDGTSGNMLVNALHDLEPFPERPQNQQLVRVVESGPSNLEMFGRAYMNAWRQPKRMLGLASKILPAQRRLRKGKKEQRFAELGPAERTILNERVSGHMVMDALTFELEELKRIKNSFNKVTINDVMLAIVSGAMQKYLTHHGHPPTGDLTTAMPINLRPMMKNSDTSDTSNLVGTAIVSLQNTVEDPGERLEAIHRGAAESKAYQDAIGADVMVEMSKSMPAYLSALAGRALPSLMMSREPMVNTVVTNVPGSKVPLYMGGAKLANSINIGLILDGLGLYHAVGSYCGFATLAFQACRDVVQDPEFYRECLAESFAELQEAADKQHVEPETETAVKNKSKAQKRPTSKARSNKVET